MGNPIRRLSFTLILALTAAAGATYAQESSVEIMQVPSNAKPINNDEATLKATDQNVGGDYQSQIINDPNMNDRARAESLMNSGQENNVVDGKQPIVIHGGIAMLKAARGTAQDEKKPSKTKAPDENETDTGEPDENTVSQPTGNKQ